MVSGIHRTQRVTVLEDFDSSKDFTIALDVPMFFPTVFYSQNKDFVKLGHCNAQGNLYHYIVENRGHPIYKPILLKRGDILTDRLQEEVIEKEIISTKVTRDFDSTKQSVIFLDREWFRAGDILESKWGLLLIKSKFKRISEADTVYNVKLHTGNPNAFLQLTSGNMLVLKGNLEDNKAEIARQKLMYSDTTYSLTVFDNTRSGKLVSDFEIFGELYSQEEAIEIVSPEPLYSEEDLVPSQFFGLNDYLKCEI